jgi:hypothetical protein
VGRKWCQPVENIPAKAILISTTDLFQGMFRQSTNTPDHHKRHHTYDVLSGGMEGVTASLVT